MSGLARQYTLKKMFPPDRRPVFVIKMASQVRAQVLRPIAALFSRALEQGNGCSGGRNGHVIW